MLPSGGNATESEGAESDSSFSRDLEFEDGDGSSVDGQEEVVDVVVGDRRVVGGQGEQERGPLPPSPKLLPVGGRRRRPLVAPPEVSRVSVEADEEQGLGEGPGVDLEQVGRSESGGFGSEGTRCQRCCAFCGWLVREHWPTMVGFVITATVSVFATLLLSHVITLPWFRSTLPLEEITLNPFSLQVSVLLEVPSDRPERVVAIAETYSRSPMVGEVILWNTNPSLSFERLQREKVRAIQVPPAMGRNARFAAAVLAQHDQVLVQDVDFTLSEAALVRLLHFNRDAPAQVHGLWGSWPTKTGIVDSAELEEELRRAPIISSRVLVARRELFGVFFQYAPVLRSHMPELSDDSPDEVLLSLAALRFNNGTLHHVHPELRDGIRPLHDSEEDAGKAPAQATAQEEKATIDTCKLLGIAIPKSASHYSNLDNNALPVQGTV